MKYETYEQVTSAFKNEGYKILAESNDLSWVYMYKIDQIRKNVTLVSWYESDGEVQRISNIEDFLLMDILDEMGYKGSISL
ncbi:hypothetical protein AF332_11635 [Sporosarcina globispora]|uniref:Uncharacterized protein n=1 Tax=Sporosarcina globispora TaxID=1459 RepID=A0A0M0GCC3_SPOGL|nr:hypothetical protein [Sporosarcina globispora]KON87413.1 hypothetical protein AF332_11635 [Sporosarcina globispora]